MIFYIYIHIYIYTYIYIYIYSLIPYHSLFKPKAFTKVSQPTWSSEFPTWLHPILCLSHYSAASLASSPIFLTLDFPACFSLLLWTPFPRYRYGWSKLTSQVSHPHRGIPPTAPSWDDSFGFSMASFGQCLHCLVPPWSITSMISNCRTAIPVPLRQEFTLSGSTITHHNQYRHSESVCWISELMNFSHHLSPLLVLCFIYISAQNICKRIEGRKTKEEVSQSL